MWGSPGPAAARCAAVVSRGFGSGVCGGAPRTLSNSTRLFTFSFILPLDHFCVAGTCAPQRQRPGSRRHPIRTIRPKPWLPASPPLARTFFFWRPPAAAALAMASFDFTAGGMLSCSGSRKRKPRPKVGTPHAHAAHAPAPWRLRNSGASCRCARDLPRGPSLCAAAAAAFLRRRLCSTAHTLTGARWERKRARTCYPAHHHQAARARAPLLANKPQRRNERGRSHAPTHYTRLAHRNPYAHSTSRWVARLQLPRPRGLGFTANWGHSGGFPRSPTSCL